MHLKQNSSLLLSVGIPLQHHYFLPQCQYLQTVKTKAYFRSESCKRSWKILETGDELLIHSAASPFSSMTFLCMNTTAIYWCWLSSPSIVAHLTMIKTGASELIWYRSSFVVIGWFGLYASNRFNLWPVPTIRASYRSSNTFLEQTDDTTWP